MKTYKVNFYLKSDHGPGSVHIIDEIREGPLYFYEGQKSAPLNFTNPAYECSVTDIGFGEMPILNYVPWDSPEISPDGRFFVVRDQSDYCNSYGYSKDDLTELIE